MKPENASYHAHHSPIGALASFTCGAHGAKGGMGIELPGPYPGEISIGYVDANNTAKLLPLFEGSTTSEAERYVEGKEGGGGRMAPISDVSREYLWATDRIQGENVCLEIHTPFFEIPDPATATPAQLAFACCPAVHLSIHFTNTENTSITGIFSLSIDHRWSSLAMKTHSNMVGAISQESIGFATQTPGAKCFIDFDAISAINRRHKTPEFLLGPTAGIEIEIPANSEKTLELVLGFYKSGTATYNREMSYYYTRHFGSLFQVLKYGLENREAYLTEASARNTELANTSLNDEQKFLIAHATRSYYGSTQWLWDGEKSVWVVNEGEYLMMNTFDLTVDMLFFEMKFNPWTVRNELEQFIHSYSFFDKVFSPDDPHTLYEGGISFTHDMGVMNHWSPKTTSSYEAAGLDRVCFSHMTCEQLTNWVLCTGIYLSQTNDQEFARRYQGIMLECFKSLQNRDNPDPKQRNGIMGFDSSRTQGGGEITTYDSLDHSLGQARNNIYLGGKMWASYVILANLFKQSGLEEHQKDAENAARLAANTIASGYNNELGYIPAILEGDNRSAIVPAIEALAYPYLAGLTEATSEAGPYAHYIQTLKQHFNNILKPGMCLYPNGAWKLSSSADNSWASKIALSQFVAKKILGIDFSESELVADRAHARWQREGAELFACSDQFRSGEPIGSLYYPRIVTNILWLKYD